MTAPARKRERAMAIEESDLDSNFDFRGNAEKAAAMANDEARAAAQEMAGAINKHLANAANTIGIDRML